MQATNNKPLYGIFKKIIFITLFTFTSLTAQALPKKSIALVAAQQWKIDHSFPWRIDSITSGTGSGVYLGGGNFLTNAHVVQNPQRIQVLNENAENEFSAKLTFISEESDLAVITVDNTMVDKVFEPASFGKNVEVGDEVTAMGFPGGLLSLAATKGVISRVYDDNYAHSGRTLPIIQVDAAVNGGASGGALLIKNKVVGIISQNVPDLQSVGHAIPLPVIKQFIKDTEDGVINGLPDLGIQTRPVTNLSKRNYYGLAKGQHALEIIETSGFAKENGLQEGDLILEYNDEPLTRYGGITGHPELDISTAVALSQIGDTVWLKLLREGVTLTRNISLSHTWSDHFVVPIVKNGQTPSWINFGGIILVEMNDGYLSDRDDYPDFLDTLNNAYIKNSECKSRAVIISNILPHSVNSGYSYWTEERITKANGVEVKSFEHLNYIINNTHSDWIELVTWPYQGRIILSRKDMLNANKELQAEWGLESNSKPAPPSSLDAICR